MANDLGDQSIGNFTFVPVTGGPTNSNDAFEAILDVEWSSAMAPGAKIRLYAPPALSMNTFIAAGTQILNDSKTDSTLRVVSLSGGGDEFQVDAPLMSESQTFAQMAAAGITICVASGDGGSNSNAGGSMGSYSPSSPLSVGSPASDPSVTAVGGTTLSFNTNYTAVAETTWFDASGGGLSKLFSRPTWQSGPGVPAGTQRCVPDVSLVASGFFVGSGTVSLGNVGAFVVFNGQPEGQAGTSLGSPAFAGLVALINQARGSAGLPAIGLLGPSIYPLIGTNAFNDITTGTNGAYNAGAGYDLCTGIGTPNMVNLIPALGGAIPPAITSQPQSMTVTVGASFSFSVVATGIPTPAYQWSKNGTPIAGATSSTYASAAAALGDAGSYTVSASNSAGSVTSGAATLAVNAAPAPAPAPAPASGTGSGGGGGAPSLWFYAALGLAGLARLLSKRGLGAAQAG